MGSLFEEIQINQLTLRNRFVMPAAIGLRESDLFSQLAQGEVGLIISGGLEPNEISEFAPIICNVHACGGKIALQLVTDIGGRFGLSADSIAVSILSKENPFFNDLVPYCLHHAATEKEIERIIASYAQAASLVKEIGADAIEIHSAHQSFLQQFLSPITNCRTDRWGGSIENCTRIHQEVLRAIRERVGSSFPILVKIGIEDAIPGGLQASDGIKIACRLASMGYDALEISMGLQDFSRLFAKGDWSGTSMQGPKQQLYYRNATQVIKKRVAVPVIMSGGVRSFHALEKMINHQEADLFGMCRPLIREPGLVARWRLGDFRPAQCVSCNRCLTERFMKGQTLVCSVDQRGAS